MCDDGIGCSFRISFHFFQKRVKIILHYVEDQYGILHFLLERVKALESTDLLKGSIWKSILIFSLPLLVGNLFQQLYNTVDSYVVGNYVSSHALAAVGQSTSIINMLVGFFMGLSTGAGVVIAQYFGAKETKKMQDSIHTSLALTLVLCVLFTILGIALSKPILVMIGSPKEVLPLAVIYLQIYFAGVSFSLIYNMGAGILRALGDSKNPLIYLVVSSLVNIVLDFVFVIYFHLGVAGVGIATTLAQLVSAILVMHELMHTDKEYKVYISKIRFSKPILSRIISIGIPAALQNSIVSFSNVIVQSYISKFGSAAVAGYSTTTKLDGFLQLPIQSFSMAITTFVGQNLGKGRVDRAKQGVRTSLAMAMTVTVALSAVVITVAPSLVLFFNSKPEVISYGTLFLRRLTPFYVLCCFNQVYAGALRGAGNSRAPMIIMLCSFVLFRQCYLYIMSNFLSNTVLPIALGYPAGWLVCSVLTGLYYKKVHLGKAVVVEK